GDADLLARANVLGLAVRAGDAEFLAGQRGAELDLPLLAAAVREGQFLALGRDALDLPRDAALALSPGDTRQTDQQQQSKHLQGSLPHAEHAGSFVLRFCGDRRGWSFGFTHRPPGTVRSNFVAIPKRQTQAGLAHSAAGGRFWQGRSGPISSPRPV